MYIPGTKKLTPLEEGDPAPEKGFFVPPALMAEIGPCLAEDLRRDAETHREWQPSDPESGDMSPE